MEETISEALEIDPGLLSTKDAYFLLTGLIVPRAIGWISTISSDDIANLSPFSFFTIASAEPPHVLFSISSARKDTLVNARASGEFVVNIANYSLIDEVVGSSVEAPPEVDEFALMELERAPSQKVKAPRVKRAHAHLECKVRDIVPVGSSFLVIGEVVHLHCDPSVWADGRVRPDLLDPVARLGGSYYAKLGEIFSRPMPQAPRAR